MILLLKSLIYPPQSITAAYDIFALALIKDNPAVSALPLNIHQAYYRRKGLWVFRQPMNYPNLRVWTDPLPARFSSYRNQQLQMPK
jgi:hypothetical protein